MKRLAVIALFSCFVAMGGEIPGGTHVLLKMVNSIDTRTAQEGDQVYLQTASPVAVNGQMVVATGTYVQGVVLLAKRSGRVAGRAELGIRLETLTLAGGRMVRITPSLSSVDSAGTDQKLQKGENVVKQGSDHGRDAARIAILAGTGAALGGTAGHVLDGNGWRGAGIGAGAGAAVGLATVLLTRGREVELRPGATLDIVFDRAVTID